jgi:predicted amidophosphoribosyltransferase
VDRNVAPTNRGTRCLACGQPLSRYTATCPKCRTPQPHKRLGSSIGLGLLIVVLIVFLAYGLLTGNADR